MKLGLAILGMMVCSIAHADLAFSSKNLSICTTVYAESQIKTSQQAHSITEEAFEKCNSELKEVYDSIGLGKAQWANLSDQQKQAISKIRDQTIS